MGKESKRKRNKVRKARKAQKRKQKQKESGKPDREGEEVPIEIESGSETSEGARSGYISEELPCLAPEMPRRESDKWKEPIQTRCGLSQKDAVLRRGPNGFFDSQGGALCASCKAIASTETSSRLSKRSFSCCSKAWCAAHLSRLLMVPECMASLPVSDARSSHQAAQTLGNAANQEGDRERLGEIAVMKYRIVGCLDENGLTRGGVGGMTKLAEARKNIEEGAPPFARGRFRDLKITIDEWGEVEEYAKREVERRRAAKRVATEESTIRAPGRSILKKDGWEGGPEKSVTFARDIADVVTIESWEKYELW